MRTELNVNGAMQAVEVEPRTTLLDALRDQLGLTGAHLGCDFFAHMQQDRRDQRDRTPGSRRGRIGILQGTRPCSLGAAFGRQAARRARCALLGASGGIPTGDR